MTKHAVRSLSGAVLTLFATAGFAAHPLFTDDTGTQGKGNWQVEVVHERGKDDVAGVTSRTSVTSLGLAYGIAETIDVFVGAPHLSMDDGVSKVSGSGDSQAGIKWRFHEQGPFSVALKPAISVATGDENRGLGTGKSGYSVFLAGTYSAAPWTFNAQVGRIHAPDVLDSPANSTAVSLGGWYEIDGVAKLVLDYGRVTNPDPAASEDNTFAIVGAIFLVNEDLDIDVGYRKGISDIETDSTVMLGVTARF